MDQSPITIPPKKPAAIDTLITVVESLNEGQMVLESRLESVIRGIGDGEKSVKDQLEDVKTGLKTLTDELRTFMKNERTAMSVIPKMNGRILLLEETLQEHLKGENNGAASV